ncbi:aminoacyl-tRNA hydrolase [Pseudoclavibacter chungangensis]|uniref:Aminoacyl-tRNA hydrolase n=1 Tax=Pseudoclavibacter chungangensis TaxID=587635 RepID=A0A7J5BR42_9MICO|nr:alternative ribosome rescue aminoacyl-tRNA hydrolase ArfB [Pseudoclavibacter chungangensis]KAB1654070.1 aminoacyl-tRNA hydrolase [Pseudoclavibacter chungangensis]NYJ66018.1 ribosome-associated protein [Pseudoclavibacter chungangensis]
MDELRIPPGPGLPEGIVVPSGELDEQFTHASGPGGQGVNTSDSRVQLRFDLGSTIALTEAQRTRALKRLGPRLTGTVVTVAAAEHRSQLRNRAAARDRLAALLREALAPPVPRRPTKPTKGSQRRRLAAKRGRAETKRNRRPPAAE